MCKELLFLPGAVLSCLDYKKYCLTCITAMWFEAENICSRREGASPSMLPPLYHIVKSFGSCPVEAQWSVVRPD
jgi:hypothetical protein